MSSHNTTVAALCSSLPEQVASYASPVRSHTTSRGWLRIQQSLVTPHCHAGFPLQNTLLSLQIQLTSSSIRWPVSRMSLRVGQTFQQAICLVAFLHFHLPRKQTPDSSKQVSTSTDISSHCSPFPGKRVHGSVASVGCGTDRGVKDSAKLHTTVPLFLCFLAFFIFGEARTA